MTFTLGEHRKRLFQSKIENDSSSDGDKTSQKTLSDRMTPPPPLLIPNTMESKGDLALKLTNVALINSYPTPWRAKVT